jgi:hypothetical protein
MGTQVHGDALTAVAWCVGGLLIGSALATFLFKRRTAR